MNRAEQKLVLELCRFKNPDAKQIEYLKSRPIREIEIPRKRGVNPHREKLRSLLACGLKGSINGKSLQNQKSTATAVLF